MAKIGDIIATRNGNEQYVVVNIYTVSNVTFYTVQDVHTKQCLYGLSRTQLRKIGLSIDK